MSLPNWAARGREKWHYRGQERPPFAIEAEAGRESVWDYPRPPRTEPSSREIVVRAGAVEIARSSDTIRILETASPPTIYIPPNDVRTEYLEAEPGSSLCEWKGTATYWSVVVNGWRLDRVAWSYPNPFPEFIAIRGYFSFYPAHLECFADGVRVLPQPGRFYGGWLTPDITGPFKGEAGSKLW